MGAKLMVAGWWTPRSVIRKELDNATIATTDALASLLREHAPKATYKVNHEMLGRKPLKAKRAAMAKTHMELIEALVEALGKDRAVKLGREAMFEVGRKLGTETRIRLGVKGPEDLAKAAKVIYRVLDIDIQVSWLNEKEATMTVNRCALAEQYSELACMVLSAIDEGIMNGLCDNATMKFTDKITAGCPKCIANIKLAENQA